MLGFWYYIYIPYPINLQIGHIWEPVFSTRPLMRGAHSVTPNQVIFGYVFNTVYKGNLRQPKLRFSSKNIFSPKCWSPEKSKTGPPKSHISIISDFSGDSFLELCSPEKSI